MSTVITVARQFGAGGHTLGKVVAARLDFALVDEEMVNAVAEKARVSPEKVHSIEKNRGDRILDFFSRIAPLSFLDRLKNGNPQGYINERIYFSHLAETMHEIAREGNTVIIGRGGQHILSDHPHACHVLLISDFAHRIAFLKRYYNMSYQEAELAILRADKQRAKFYNKLGARNFEDPNLYHLVLNVSKIGLEKAEDIVCRMAKRF